MNPRKLILALLISGLTSAIAFAQANNPLVSMSITLPDGETKEVTAQESGLATITPERRNGDRFSTDNSRQQAVDARSGDQLRHHAIHGIHGHRKAHAGGSSRRTEDRRVDADQSSCAVE